MGYANALALILFVVIIAITIMQFRISRLWVHSE
jgi:multiple sugar transport system permease protein